MNKVIAKAGQAGLMTMFGYEVGKNMQEPVIVKVNNDQPQDITPNVATVSISSSEILMWVMLLVILVIVLIIFLTIASMFRAKMNERRVRAAVQI